MKRQQQLPSALGAGVPVPQRGTRPDGLAAWLKASGLERATAASREMWGLCLDGTLGDVPCLAAVTRAAAMARCFHCGPYSHPRKTQRDSRAWAWNAFRGHRLACNTKRPVANRKVAAPEPPPALGHLSHQLEAAQKRFFGQQQQRTDCSVAVKTLTCGCSATCGRS